MKYGTMVRELSGIASELSGIANELADLAEKLNKAEAAAPEIKIKVPEKVAESTPTEPALLQKAMLSVEEAGELLGVSRQLTYQLARRDDFPCLRIGRRMLIPRHKLIEWVDNHCGGKVVLKPEKDALKLAGIQNKINCLIMLR